MKICKFCTKNLNLSLPLYLFIYLFIFMRPNGPNWGLGRLTVEVSRSHTDTHIHMRSCARARSEASARVISSPQRPLPTQLTQTQETKTHDFSRIRSHDPWNPAASELYFRPHDHRSRLCFTSKIKSGLELPTKIT